MKAAQIRLPRALLRAVPASIAAVIVSSIIIEQIVVHLPFTPTARILSFLALNRNNPAVYHTYYYLHLAPLAEYLDAYIVTPLAMLIGGLALGMFARRANSTPRESAVLGAGLGALCTVITIGATWLMIAFLVDRTGGTLQTTNEFSLSAKACLQSTAEIALCAFAYGFGSWIVARWRGASEAGETIAPRSLKQRLAGAKSP